MPQSFTVIIRTWWKEAASLLICFSIPINEAAAEYLDIETLKVCKKVTGRDSLTESVNRGGGRLIIWKE